MDELFFSRKEYSRNQYNARFQKGWLLHDTLGDLPPHQCSLSVGLRYAPASSEAALMRESSA
jgi:hypothetical protein